MTPNYEVRRTRSGRVWRCDTGEHRYHRDLELAETCAWLAAMPPLAFTGEEWVELRAIERLNREGRRR